MRFRSLAMSALWIGLFVTTVMALRAADEKAKGKEDDVPPSPGTVKFTTAPAAVQKTFKEESKNADIKLLGKSEDGTFFKATVRFGTNDYEVAVSKDGLLLEKMLVSARTEVMLKDCPAPVQKALGEDSKGGKIETIVKETAGKRSDYHFVVAVQAVQYELTIADDGTLLAKEILDDGTTPKENPAEKPVKKSK